MFKVDYARVGLLLKVAGVDFDCSDYIGYKLIHYCQTKEMNKKNTSTNCMALNSQGGIWCPTERGCNKDDIPNYRTTSKR